MPNRLPSPAVAQWAASIANTDPTPAEIAAGQRIAANLTPPAWNANAPTPDHVEIAGQMALTDLPGVMPTRSAR